MIKKKNKYDIEFESDFDLDEPEKIDNWTLDRSNADDKITTVVLVGDINGKSVRTDVIYWLDLNDRIAMTQNEIYRLGDPDPFWHSFLLSNGITLKDMQIKSTTH